MEIIIEGGAAKGKSTIAEMVRGYLSSIGLKPILFDDDIIDVNTMESRKKAFKGKEINIRTRKNKSLN